MTQLPLLLWEQPVRKTEQAPSLDQVVQQEQKHIKIPGRTESPITPDRDIDYLCGWILQFHKDNKLPVPKGIRYWNYDQLQQKYRGILQEYNITVQDILPD